MVLGVAFRYDLDPAHFHRLDDDIGESRLNGRMQVYLRLFEQHGGAMRDVSQQNEHRQDLADSEADIREDGRAVGRAPRLRRHRHIRGYGPQGAR